MKPPPITPRVTMLPPAPVGAGRPHRAISSSGHEIGEILSARLFHMEPAGRPGGTPVVRFHVEHHPPNHPSPTGVRPAVSDGDVSRETGRPGHHIGIRCEIRLLRHRRASRQPDNRCGPECRRHPTPSLHRSLLSPVPDGCGRSRAGWVPSTSVVLLIRSVERSGAAAQAGRIERVADGGCGRGVSPHAAMRP